MKYILRKLWSIAQYSILGLLLLTSCEYLENLRGREGASEDTPIARVQDKYLYQRDLTGIVPPRTASEDSADMANRYVDSWIRKQLLMFEAESRLAMDEVEINRRIEDYRYDLIVYAYEKQFLEEHLDTAVTDTQIEEYYKENKSNFELRQNIVKAYMITVPKQAQGMGNLKRWMQSSGTGQLEKIREYAYRYGSNYHLNDSLWIDFEDLTLGTPFAEELDNNISVLKRKSFFQTSDSLHNYFIKVLEYKLTSDISPITFVREQVRDIIINRRRVDLQRSHEKDILNRAEKNEDYEIFE